MFVAIDTPLLFSLFYHHKRHYYYMWWFVASWGPSHFMNQCRHIVQWTFWTDSMKVYNISHLLPICDMWWLVALRMPILFLNQCRHIVQWIFLKNSMSIYGMSHLLPMCDIARVCIEVYCLLNVSRLIHVMASHLTGDRPLPEPQLTYFSLKPFEQTQALHRTFCKTNILWSATFIMTS